MRAAKRKLPVHGNRIELSPPGNYLPVRQARGTFGPANAPVVEKRSVAACRNRAKYERRRVLAEIRRLHHLDEREGHLHEKHGKIEAKIQPSLTYNLACVLLTGYPFDQFISF